MPNKPFHDRLLAGFSPEVVAMAAAGGAAAREGSAKARVADHISQAVLSTSNLLHLMQQSSPSQALLTSLPKNLLAKVSVIKNTEQMLEQMPQVISSLDAYMEQGLQSSPHLGTVTQLLANMDGQVKNAPQNHALEEEPELTIEPSEDT